MLFRKLIRTVGVYKAQFISMIIMIALGTGVFVGFNMEWVSIEESMFSFFEDTGYADYRVYSEGGFTEEQLKKAESIKGVKSASRFLSVNADVKQKNGDSVALTVTTNPDISGIIVTSGEEYDKDSENGIWLSDKYAAANDVKVGDKLTLSYKGLEIDGEVKGLAKSGEYMVCVRDETQLMPDFTTYGFAYITPKLYEKSAAAFYPQLHIKSDLPKSTLTKRLENKLNSTLMIVAKEDAGSYSLAEGEADEGKTMGSILPVLFLAIAVLTMVTTMHRLTAKEKIQIGTLKALGFHDRRITLHYTSYAFVIGVVGSLIGIAIGVGIASFIMNPNGMMGTYMDLPKWKLRMPVFCTVLLLCLIAVLTLIGFLSVKNALKGNAADALRPYVPKKMKPLIFEKTKLFHKLSFGTRWNLRDIMRHKSRTAMSLIGTVGCTIIVICAFGMSDTMDAFLDMYYSGATNYSSRIYLAEDATDEARQDIANKYNGDWSGTVSVELGEKAISLDVYNVTHDRVRFPNEKCKYQKLENDGAYICMRAAKENNLKVGDTFTISPYGSSKKYKLRVAGLLRSVSESITVTSDYAEKVGVPYKVDSVYTNTEKGSIEKTAAIKSVQSKRAIIDSFGTFTQLMNSMIIVLVAGALLLGVVVLYNLGVMSYTERYREMATLKVVGFRDKKIGSLLIGQNLWLSLVGVALGIPLGAMLLKYLLDALASEYEMQLCITVPTYFISVLLTVGMSLLVSLMVSRKNKKIDMVEALKGTD